MSNLMQRGFSRRNLLKGFAAGAGASTLGWTSLFGISRAFAQDAAGTNDDLQTIINVAATAELFASTHYLAAINGDMGLDPVQINYLKAAFITERDHLDLLVSLGAAPVVTEFYVPDGLFSDKGMFAAVTEVAETAFVAAYLAATRIFTEMAQPAFAVTAAQISAVEAEHRSFIRQIAALLPNDRSYQEYLVRNVSDAVPILQPFLDGSGDGFVGPVQPPTDDEVAAIRAESEALGYSTILPYAAMATMAAPGMDSAAMMVTAGSRNVNVRSSPSTAASVLMVLNSGSSAPIDGQRTIANMVWWHIVGGGWVRADTVTTTDGADSLPGM